MIKKTYITSIGEILFDVYKGERQIGGAPFNFIYHINKITGNTNFVTAVGSDDEGNEIINFIKEQNISTKFVDIKKDIETGEVLIELDDNKIPNFTIHENRAYDYINLSQPEEEEIIAESKLIYFGTLSQRNEVSRKTIQKLVSNSLQSMFDINIRQKFYTKEIIEKSLTACTILKINEEELNLISDLCLEKSDGYYQTVKKIKEKYNIDLILRAGKVEEILYSKEFDKDFRKVVFSFLHGEYLHYNRLYQKLKAQPESKKKMLEKVLQSLNF